MYRALNQIKEITYAHNQIKNEHVSTYFIENKYEPNSEAYNFQQMY